MINKNKMRKKKHNDMIILRSHLFTLNEDFNFK